MSDNNIKIGDRLTPEEFNEFKSKYIKYRIGVDYYKFDDGLLFKEVKDEKDGTTMWELVSTLESRIKEQGKGPNVHRPEQRNYKRYYEGKS